MQVRIGLLLAVFFALILSGCSAGETTGSPEGVLDGQALFQETLINQSPGCVTCHSLEPGVTLVGPSMAGVASRAETIVNSPDYTGDAQTADGYLREAIVEPDAYVPEGFVAGTMYQNYASSLSNEQIDALVDYMLTLEE